MVKDSRRSTEPKRKKVQIHLWLEEANKFLSVKRVQSNHLSESRIIPFYSTVKYHVEIILKCNYVVIILNSEAGESSLERHQKCSGSLRAPKWVGQSVSLSAS